MTVEEQASNVFFISN